MKILISGLGSIGRRHANNCQSLGCSELIGVDPDCERRKRFEQETNGSTYINWDDAVASGGDLAIITSPNRFHVDQALLAANAGLHLFVEKPLGISRDGVNELIAIIQKKELFAHVGSNWKFHPAFQRMKTLLDARQVGKVTCVQVLAGQWLPDWHPWEDYRKGYSARADLGGGIVFDSHELDCLTWLLGDVESITGFTSNTGILDITTEDIACACIRFKNGALASISMDYLQRSYRRQYHISGDRGTMEWDIQTGRLSVYDAISDTTTTEDVNQQDLNEMYVRQLRHIFLGISQKVDPITPVSQASEVLELQLRLKEGCG